MSLVNVNELLEHATKHGYGVAAINTINYETIRCAIDAAEQEDVYKRQGLYYISDSSKYSIQQLLNVMVQNIRFLTQYGRSTGGDKLPSISLRMAIAFVAMLPVLIVYPFLQKYFEKGVTLGAVKG